ncbi:TetR/AcrR family transcriptional regulator [Sphingopyxis flava]|uniref:Transcriptional regulator, TetR family n=1 Tax=Sphingopyxis flava TaxID=1507287 RepID=A0A1T5E4R7_9SPHN|nr:TetR/AcrR family transcriptional regulator [Sphingopyxis flava]SKB79052.1 transcriptional regulator, TetR family [Sphingopyxis flava]
MSRTERIPAATQGPDRATTPPGNVRRRRRTRENVEERICDAARQVFAERGYHGATTRGIASVADVSETLLFRYYRSKAILFEEVIVQPFNRFMQEFLQQYPTNEDRKSGERRNFVAAYELFEKNRSVFIALLAAKGTPTEEGGEPSFIGLLPFFNAAAAEQVQKYADLGTEPPFDMGLGIRLAFGMLASSVLMSDWLFPEGTPPREQLVDLLELLVDRALDPLAARDSTR